MGNGALNSERQSKSIERYFLRSFPTYRGLLEPERVDDGGVSIDSAVDPSDPPPFVKDGLLVSALPAADPFRSGCFA